MAAASQAKTSERHEQVEAELATKAQGLAVAAKEAEALAAQTDLRWGSLWQRSGPNNRG